MAHIICMTSGLTGILNASLELCHRLESMGHQVSYVCPWDVRTKVEANGFTFYQLSALNFDPAPSPPVKKGRFSRLKRWTIRLWSASFYRKQGLEHLGQREFQKCLEDLKPDLILLDVELQAHIITVFSKGYAFALLSQWFSHEPHPQIPPFETDIIPGKGWKGQSGAIRFFWRKKRLEKCLKLQKAILSRSTKRYFVIKLYARIMGFPSRFIDPFAFPPPFNFKKLPLISTNSQHLEFPFPVAPDFHYVGVMVNRERKEPRENPHLTAQLEAIFLEKETRGKKLIYANYSTMGTGDIAFLKKILAAVQAEDDWLLILGLGGKLEAAELGEPGPQIKAFSWLPQLKVLEQADVAIHHGGIHTINECIVQEVPMLAYSGKKYDQNGCAARVAFHGIGLMGDKDKASPEDIRQNIQRLLEEDAFRNNIKKMNQLFQKEIEARQLERLIPQFLQAKRENKEAARV